MDAYDNSAKLFKALMHPARLEILDILRDGEACVCHIEAALDATLLVGQGPIPGGDGSNQV